MTNMWRWHIITMKVVYFPFFSQCILFIPIGMTFSNESFLPDLTPNVRRHEQSPIGPSTFSFVNQACGNKLANIAVPSYFHQPLLPRNTPKHQNTLGQLHIFLCTLTSVLNYPLRFKSLSSALWLHMVDIFACIMYVFVLLFLSFPLALSSILIFFFLPAISRRVPPDEPGYAQSLFLLK